MNVFKNILKNRVVAGTAIGLSIAVFLAILNTFSVFNSLNLKFTDSLYTRNEPSKDIIIIAIDEKSTMPEPEGLGYFAGWSRKNYTKILANLQKENPKVIVFDILFRTPTKGVFSEDLQTLQAEIIKQSTNKEKFELYEKFFQENSNPLNNKTDEDFAKKLEEFDNMILAFNGDPKGPAYPMKKFSKNATLGNVNALQDSDGVMRRVKPIVYVEEEQKYYDDIALASVKLFKGIDKFELPLEDDNLIVNYFADPFNFPAISFVDVMHGNFEQGMFENKIVLVGINTFRALDDRVNTPKSNTLPMPGVEFRANEIQTILDGEFLNNQSKVGQILTITAIAIALTIAYNFLGIALSIILALLAIGIEIALAHFAYSRGLIINMVYPFLAIALSYLASWIYKYFIADKNKRELKSAFGHYVSGELVEQISKNPDIVKLGGEKRMITVFFSDIKDSTAHSEKTPIESWVSQINEYFTVMEGIVKSFGGTLDKYEGDAVMGFWNAPIAQEDHVLKAYLAALAMRRALKRLHEKWQPEGRPLIEFRIGINTGEALVGNFGSIDRFDYTVMGDTVNTASRLESSANKSYGTMAMVGGFNGNISAENLGKVTLREIDTVLLPGKKEPVVLFELVGLAEDFTAEIKAKLKAYADGLAAYRKKDFVTAAGFFKASPDDTPSKIMLARCEKLQSGEKIAELDESMVFRILNK